jgi:multicomponent Na+:H+ antiporter subunit G
MIREILIAALLLSGILLILIAAFGVVRLPDLYCRAHALAKAVTLGIMLLLLGLWLHLADEGVGLKISLAIFFQFVTIPVAGHLLMLVARQKNIPRWKPRPEYDHRVAGREQTYRSSAKGKSRMTNDE